jgi:hypothetical protein
MIYQRLTGNREFYKCGWRHHSSQKLVRNDPSASDVVDVGC